MSHHYSGPDFGFPYGDARLDLTDLYAFPKPGDADKSILIMNVHPSAVVNPPGSTTREPFAPKALYELKIDTDGDAVADIAYRVRFSSIADGSQTATVRLIEGAQAAETGDSGQMILSGLAPSTPIWLTGVPGVGFGTSEPGSGDGLCGLRLVRYDGAAGPHGPGLSPVPLPRVRQAVQ
jgi:hypothetical protein